MRKLQRGGCPPPGLHGPRSAGAITSAGGRSVGCIAGAMLLSSDWTRSLMRGISDSLTRLVPFSRTTDLWLLAWVSELQDRGKGCMWAWGGRAMRSRSAVPPERRVGARPWRRAPLARRPPAARRRRARAARLRQHLPLIVGGRPLPVVVERRDALAPPCLAGVKWRPRAAAVPWGPPRPVAAGRRRRVATGSRRHGWRRPLPVARRVWLEAAGRASSAAGPPCMSAPVRRPALSAAHRPRQRRRDTTPPSRSAARELAPFVATLYQSSIG